MANPTGAQVIAQELHDLGVTVIHTLVGIPVADIAEESIDLGIRVIGYRNEQACSYAASAYGYLTGKPGVCILTGGPGILHGMAGVSKGSASIRLRSLACGILIHGLDRQCFGKRIPLAHARRLF